MRLLALTLCLVVTTVAQAPPSAPEKRLVVQVTEVSTPKPRQDLELYLEDPDLNPIAGPVQPNSAGKVEFRVPPGNYLLRAETKRGQVHYHNQLPDGFVGAIPIAPEDTTVSVVFPVALSASLSGTVRDDLGEPLQDVNVELTRASWYDGRVGFQATHSARTDDLGRFRIDDVSAGAYIACASPHSLRRAPEIGPVDFSQKPRDRFYQRACHPAEPASTSRIPASIQLFEGQQANVDLVLNAAPTVRVSGRVTISGEFNHVNLRLIPNSLFRRQTDYYASPNSNDPTFTFAAVPPGSYRLEAQTQTKEQDLFASIAIEVGGTNLEGVGVTLEPAATVELAWSDDDLASGVATVSIVPVEHQSDASLLSPQPKVKQKFPPLRPGNYWLKTRTNNRDPRVCVVGARLGETDVFQQPLTITADMQARLTLQLSTDCARMDLRAVSKGKSAPLARFVVLLRGTPDNPGDAWSGFADDDGGLSLFSIVPGRYLVWAWCDDEKGLVSGPPDLASIARFAQVVEVKKGVSERADIQVFDWLADWKERSNR